MLVKAKGSSNHGPPCIWNVNNTLLSNCVKIVHTDAANWSVVRNAYQTVGIINEYEASDNLSS